MSQTKAQLIDPVDLSIVTADLADDAVTAAKLASNAVVNASVDSSAAIAGTKISPDFGSQNIVTTGDLTINSATPIINLTDTNNDSDYQIKNGNGDFNIKDVTNNANRISINSSGTVTVAQHMDVGAGLDVTGAITGTTSLTLGNTSLSSGYLINTTGDLYIRDTNGNIFIEAKTDQHAIRCIADGAVMLHHSGSAKLVTSSAGIDVTGAITGTADLTVNTSTLKVDSSNSRVGVGTASPSTILHIKTSNPDVHLENTGTGTGQLRLGHFTNSAFIGTYNDDGGASDALRLGTHSGNERMRITSDGKVGIGTSSPTDALSVVGDINLMDNGTIFGGDDAANTLILRSTSGNANHSRIDVGVSEGSDNGGLHFYTAGSSEATRRITIKGTSGNVGIGNTSPQGQLHIGTSTGTSDREAIIILNNGGATGQEAGIEWRYETSTTPRAKIHLDSSGQDLRFATANSERMRIDSSGRVGIGTTSPNQNLMVMDAIANEPQIRIETSDGGSKRLDLFVDSSSNAVISAQQSAQNIEIKSRNHTIFSQGGTSAEVESMRIKSDSDVLLTRATAGGGGDETLLISANYGAGSAQALQASNSLRFYTNGTNERVRITSAGIVGIGTTAPEGKGLDVTVNRTNNYAEATDTRNLANIICRNSSDAAGRFAALSFINGGGTQAEGSINLVQTADYNGDLAFKLRTAVSTWKEAMRIKSDGRIFIGNSNPAAAANADDLCVGDNDGSGETGITLGSNTASGIRFADGANNSAGVFEYQHANDRFAFATVSSVRLRIDADGIKFGSDTAAANALDDYEEGTWTATLGPNSGEFTPTSNTNTCYYTKIGRQVTVIGIAKMTTPSSLNSYTNDSTSHALSVSGLPFTILDAINARSAATLGVGGDIQFPNGVLASHGNNNSTSFSVFVNKSNGGIRTAPTLAVSTSMNFHFSFTYFI